MGRKDPRQIRQVVMVCTGSDCRKSGAKGLVRIAKHCLKQRQEPRCSHVVRTKCQGFCKRAPVVSVQPENLWLAPARGADLQAVLAFDDPTVEVAHSAPAAAEGTTASSSPVAPVASDESPELPA